MRIKKLQEKMPENLDGILIVSPENRRYFTEFPSTAGVLVVSRDKSVFLTDSRYVEAAGKKIKVCPVREMKNLSSELPEIMHEFNIKNLGIETDRVTLCEYSKYKAMLKNINIVVDSATDRVINSLRMVKTKEEIEKMIAAQRIAEQALEHMFDFIKPGMTEKEVQLELDYTMLKNGAAALSFDTIAVSGVNSSMPHGVASDKKIEVGDFLTMDFGAVVDGYHSDMTRTVAIGKVSDEQRKVYNTVLNAQQAAFDVMRAGVASARVDKAARDYITEAGYGEFFRHSTGHGVGIEIHEHPFVSPTAPNILEVGNVITDEPGIYLPGKFGVRIEDFAVITEDGYYNMTKAPKELIIL